MKLKTFLHFFGGTMVCLTLLPFIAIDYWWIRIFDFPHFQLTMLTLTSAICFLIRFELKNHKDYIFLAILISCFIFQMTKIYPYTPLAKFEVMDSSSNNNYQNISIYTANVLQKNQKTEKLISTIKSQNFDILLFVETNNKWKNQIDEATSDKYKYNIGLPLSNTYGMLLYSKFRLINPEVKFIVDDSIPSIHSLFLLPSGDTIQLFAIHPTPPMPQHNMSSTDRDAEMMKIALQSLESKYPVLVLGDFNDVAWSESTQNFQKISRLLDPRKGRGFYNTYHANYFFFRWPLDHVFVSKHFKLTTIKREKTIDSDHFPISVDLTFEPEKASIQRTPYPSKENIEKAKEQIKAEKEEEKN